MSFKTALDLIKDYGSDSDEEGRELPENVDPDGVEKTADLSMPQLMNNNSSSDSEPGRTSDPEKLTKRKKSQIESRKKRMKTHHLIDANCGCTLSCPKVVSRDRRNELNFFYWSLSLEERRSFILKHSSRLPVQRRRVKYICAVQRKFTYSYSLEDDQGLDQAVCVAFFLNTLGYPATSRFVNFDRFLSCLYFMQTNIKSIHHSSNFIYRTHENYHHRQSNVEKRGKHHRINPMEEAVKIDIMSYSPTISHYRMEHAPNALYLPSDLTCRAMYDSFNRKRSNEAHLTCSYSFYCKQLSRMNIRFTKLGHELCEKCREAEVHMKQANHVLKTVNEAEFLEEGYPVADRSTEYSADEDENNLARPVEDCVRCLQWQEHKNAAILSRSEYEKDKATFEGLAVSVDLQKVIQLPRMEGFKEAIFAKRIIAMNETFAPLGGHKNGPVHAVVWNETISGRKACDILSTFTQHLLENKGHKHVLYWLDNCASQNKNWDLMMHMILLVNSSMITADEITFKYLETGHTFMSADSFHAAVEKRMRLFNNGEIHTYDDFVDCIKQANIEPAPVVTTMEHTDFFEPSFHFKPSVVSKLKDRPKLANIKAVSFVRGSHEFNYRHNFSEKWKHCTIFTKQQLKQARKDDFDLKSTLKYRDGCRGIEGIRKTVILRKLTPLMPPEKRFYWENLPETEISEEF